MPATERSPELARDRALSARPVTLAAVSREDREDGGLRISVSVARPKWHRWLGGVGAVQHSFDLDAFGRSVYERCDGTREVRAMIEDFAAEYHVSVAEAEMSVTKFLNTLMSRGLIGMGLDRQEAEL